MDWAQVEGRWKELSGRVRQRWGRLTDDQVLIIAGRREELAGVLQRVYGRSGGEAEQDIDEFCRSCAE